jgi:gliding motility-associated-like protein
MTKYYLKIRTPRESFSVKFFSIILFFSLLLFTQQAFSQNCSVNAGIPQTICANQRLYLQGSFTAPLQAGAQVTWVQVGGPAAIIVDTHVLNTEVTNLLAGNSYTFRISTTCADGAFTYQDVTHTVKAISIANAGTDATYCPGINVGNLQANAPGTNETGSWTGSGSNGVTINNTTSPTSTISLSGNSSGSATLRWTITNSLTGCSSYDDVVITNRGGLSPVNAGIDQVLNHCFSSTQSTTLSGSYGGSNVDGQQGTWTIVSGPNVPIIVSSHAQNTSVTGLIEGVYVFRWTVVGTCTSGADEVQITVPAPTANVTSSNISGGNQVFCDPATTSTVITGTTPLYINETVTWIQTGGPALPPGSIVNPNSPVTAINNLLSPNTYTFNYTINNPITVCSSSANISVSYLPNPPSLAITTTDPVLLDCGVNTATIKYNASGSGTTQYRLISGPGTGYPTPWSNASTSAAGNGLSQDVNGLTDIGTYRLQMRRSSTIGSAPACGTVYDEISIVTSLNSGISNAGTDQNLNCDVSSTDLVGNVPLVGEGTWSQVSGPSAIILTSPHSPTLSIGGLLPDGLYIFRWLISGGSNCNVSQDDVQVYTAQTSPNTYDAGPNQINVCYSTPLYLNATPPAFVFERGNWTVNPSAGITISDSHSPKAIVTGLLPYTTYTFTWSISNGCGSESDFMTVDVIDQVGPIVAKAGTDQCIGSGTTSISLAGNSPSPGTGIWTLVSGPNIPVISTASSATLTVTGMVNGTYKFEWAIYSGGCSPTRDTVMVTIDTPVTTASIGADLIVCGSSVTLNAAGSAPAKGTGKWTQVSGNAGVKFNGSSDQSTWTNYAPFISDLQAGVYVFRYTITNGACSSSDDVSVFVSEPASPANIALANNGVCGASSISLVADAITTGSGIWTIISGPNTPSIVSSNSSTTNVTGLITGSYKFRWTVSGGPFCPSTSDEITIDVTLNANAGSDQSYCEAITSVNLTGTTASSGTWTQIGTTPNIATITTTGGNTAIASGLIAGVYTFEYKISTTGCTSTDDMTVTLYPPPSVADAGADQELCNAATFTMNAAAPVSGTGTWSKLSGPSGGSFSNLNNRLATFSGAVPGVYVFQWTVANSSCSNADQVRITNYAAPSAAVAGPNQNVTCTSISTMAATNPINGLGTWTFVSKTGDGPIPTISNPLLYNSTITGLGPKSDGNPETYTFRWTVSNGNCASNISTVTITVYQTATVADAGTDQLICNQTSATLAATPVTIGTGTWTQVSPTVTTESFSDSHLSTATVNNIIPGTNYVFRWTSATAFCSSYDEISIINAANPSTANVSGTSTSYCALVPVALVGNTPAVGTGTWSQISGSPLSILSPNSSSTLAIGGTTGNSYGFRYTISNGNCISSSADVTVTMNSTPTQALAGADQEICSPSTLAILAGNTISGGGETGLWTIVTNAGGTPSFTDATNPTTTISGLVGGTPNIYELKWEHKNGGCISSDNMFITVWAATTSADAGIAQTRCNANSFTMAGNAVGIGETGSWVRISGPNNPSITTPNSPTTTISGTVPGTYQFRWRITSGKCPYTEDFVTITNRTPITLSGLSNASICTGGTQILNVSASGGTGSYNYQWQYNNGSWTNVGLNISTFTTPVLTTGSYQYRVIVTDKVSSDDGGCSTTGSSIVTAVNDPAITLQPSNPPDICVGGTTDNMTLTASGGTPILTYQWQYNNGSWNNVSNGSPIGATYSGATSSSMNVTGISAAGAYDYRCVVSATGNDCATVNSSTVTATVIADPTLTDPVFTNNTICTGGSTIVSSTISGGTGTPTYQWQYYNGTTWNNVVNATPAGTTYTNATTNSMTISGASSAGTRQYRLTTTNSSGCNFNSNGASYSVVGDPGITTQPAAPAAICVGGTSANMTIAASGGTPSLSYQWQLISSGTWNPVVDGIPAGALYSGSTGTTFSVSGITAAGAYQYRCQVTATGNGCGTATSTARTLTVVADPAITSHPSSSTICSGVSQTMSVTATGGTPALIYLWESSASGTNTWTSVGGNSSGYTTAALTADTDFRVTISATGNDCNSVTSSTATITVNNFTSANTILSNQTICSGTTASLTGNDVTADGAISYQWQYKTSLGGTYSDVPSGGTGRDYTTPALTSNTWYQRIATSTLNGVLCTLTSNEIKVSIPTISTQPASNPASCEGVANNMTIVVDGGSATLNYQWQFSDFDCISGWNDIVGATTASYTALAANLPPLGGTRYFRCIVTIGTPVCSDLVSDCAAVTVVGCNPKIGVAKQLVSMDNKSNGTYEAVFNIRVQNYGGTQLDNIQVTDNLNTTFSAGNYSILGISSANFAVNTAFNGNTDQNLLVTLGNSLAKNASSDIRLRVKILSAGSYSNTCVASSTTGGVTDNSQNGSDPDPNHNGNPDESSPTPVNTACSPVVSVVPTDGEMCHPNITFNQTFQIAATASNATSYLWTTDGTGTFSSTTSLTPTYKPSASDVQDGQVRLHIVANSGGVCPNAEADLILTIWTTPSVDAGPAATICSGNNHNLTGAVAYNYTALTWTSTGDGTFDNSNSLNPVYTPGTNDKSNGSVSLTLKAIAEGTCTDVSDNMLLTITPAPTVDAGPDATICSSAGSFTISVASTSNQASRIWTTNGTGTFSSASTLTPIYTPSSADIATGQVQLTLTAIGNGSCNIVSDMKVLNIWPAASAYAGTNATICSGDNYVLTGATASNYSTITWTSTGGTFNNANALNPTFTPTTTGPITITLTATGLGTCSNAVSFLTLTVNAAQTLTSGTITNTQCNASVGSIVLTASSPGTITVNGSSQAVSAGDLTKTFNGLPAGFYTATFTATTGGCTATKSVNIANSNSTLAATVSIPPVACYGGTATATVTASGGTGAGTYTFSINAGAFGASNVFSGLMAGSYNIVVKDGNSCTFSLAFAVTVPAQLVSHVVSQTNVLCYGLSSGSITLTSSGGTAPYQYSLNGIDYQTSNLFTGLAASVTPYTITTKDAGGCTIASTTATITGPSAALDITSTAVLITHVTCNGAANGAIDITVADGTEPYRYVWSNGSASQDIAGLTAGTYTVTVTDANGCTKNGSYTVNQPAAQTLTSGTITNTQCNASVGSIVLTASSPGTITVNGSSQAVSAGDLTKTFNGLPAGFYTATFTATTGGCTATKSFNIANNNSTLAATVSIPPVACFGGTATATVTTSGGTGAGTYTFSINGGAFGASNVFSGLMAGSYNIVVKDGNSCTFSLAFAVTVPAQLVSHVVSQTNVLCYGLSSGSITLTSSGGTAPYQYSLNGIDYQTSNLFTGLAASVTPYTITTKDAGGCTIASTTATITGPSAALDITSTAVLITHVTCNGAANGAIDITVADGTEPYRYVWSNGSASQDIAGLTAGTYTVTVTDANGCTKNGSYTVNQPAAQTLTSGTITNTQCNASVGSIVLTASSPGTITVNGSSQAVSAGDLTKTFNGLPAGFYTATFTATTGGCTATKSFNIANNNSTLAATVNIPPVACFGGTATATVTASGGTGAGTYTFSINGGVFGASNVFSGLTAGSYNIVVKDANSCTYHLAFNVDQPTILILSKTSQANVSCKGLSDGSVILTGSGGTTDYSYSIVSQPIGGSASVSANVVSGMKAGLYTLRVTDSHNCTADLAITISESVCHPVGVDDNRTAPEDNVVSGNVLDNDSDLNGFTLNVTQFVIGETTYLPGNIATISGIGTLKVNSDGTYTFTPQTNFNGTVPVATYTLTNGTNTATAHIHITITPLNDSPLAVIDLYSVSEGTILNNNLSLNDTPSGDGGNIWSLETNPSHGILIINIDGTFTYTPDTNYNGPDNFSYKLCDTDGSCSSTAVSLTIVPVNDPPVVADVPKSGSEDFNITFTALDFTSKYTDIDNDPMSQIQVKNLPAHGLLKLSGVPVNAGDVIALGNLSNLVFTPDANWNGSTSFDWNGFDGTDYAAANEQVNLTVTPVNDIPIAGIATMPSQLNPGGTNSILVFANNFSGTDPNDPNGFITSIQITNMPSNATSITVDGVKYNSIPFGGILITTNATGQPLFNISVDPIDGAVTSIVFYRVVDNEGAISTNTGTVTIPFNGLSVTGTIFNDVDGLSDNIVNGTPTNAAGMLFMNLVNTLNQVVASKAVAANGTYTFAEADGLTVNTSYKLILTNGAKTPGATLSAATYPSGISSTGENIGSGLGNDGKIDGILNVDTNSGSLTDANFGISGAMSVSAGADAAICSSDGTYTLKGTASNSSSVLWTSNGTGTFNNQTLLNAIYTPSEADIATGEVQLTLTVNGVGSIQTMSDAMTLTIWRSATAYAGIDQSVCRGDVYQVLDANISHAASILWTVNPGSTGTLSGATTLTPVYTPGASEVGVIKLTLTITPEGNGTCSQLTDSKTLTITDPPTVVLGPDINNCALNATMLTGIATNYSRLEWTSSGTGTFSSANTLSTIYTPSLADINYAQVTLKLTAKGNGSCTSVSDEIVLKLWRNTYAYAGEDVTVCNTQAHHVLDAEATDYVSLSWSHNGTGTLTNSSTLSPTYTPGSGETGPVALKLTVIPEGSGTCPTFSDQKIITIGAAPAVFCPLGSPFVFNNTAEKCGYVVTNTSLDATGSGCNGLVSVTHNFSAWGNPNSLAGATFPVGLTPVVWTAKDSFGNTSSCTILVRVIDNEPPTFVNCSSNTTFTIGLSPDACETGAIWSRPVAIDNCDLPVSLIQTKGPAQGSILAVGTYVIEYTATDRSGNSSKCSFTIKVIDTERPLVVCRPDFEVQADKGTCNWKSPVGSISPLLARSNCASSVNWEITNPDGSKSTGTNDASGYIFQKGISKVRYSNQENAANQSWECSFQISVVDKEAPIIICPAPNVQIADAGGCKAKIMLTAPSFSDNCSGTVLSTSYTVVNPNNSQTGPYTSTEYTFMSGISRVLWTLTDKEGNSTTCMQQVTVNSDPSVIKPDAGADATICEGSDYTLSGASVAHYSSLKWSSEGSGKFSDPTRLNPVYKPSLADIINGQVVLSLTASSECASSTSTMTLIINHKSSVRAGTAKNAYSCEGADYLLIGAIQSNATSIEWTTSGTGTFSNKNELNSTYHPSEADITSGNVTLTISGKSAIPCGESSDSIILHLIKQSTADAGTDATICEGSTYDLASAASSYATSVLWKTSGSGTFSNIKATKPVYTPSFTDILNGYAVLTISAESEAPCGKVQDEMVITISRKSFVKAGAEKEVFACSGSDYKITGASQTNATSIKWTTSGTGTFADASNLNTTYRPGKEDYSTGAVLLTLAGKSASPCGDSSDQIMLHLATEAVVNAGMDASICQNFSFEVSGEATHATNISWKSNGTGIFSDAKALKSVYKPSAADIMNGTVLLTLTATSEYPCSAVQDQLLLTISQQPKADAGSDFDACSGDLVKFGNTSALNYQTLQWFTTGQGKLSGENTLHPTYKPVAGEAGKLQFVFMVKGSGICNTEMVTDTIYLTYHKDIQVNLMSADTILYNTTATLNISGTSDTGNYIYRWEPSNLVPNFTSNRAQTVPLTESTLFTVSITDVNTGCSVTDQIMIIVENKIDNLINFYTGITPNGDGNNDTWWIEGIEKFPNNEVMIFNRWGDKIIDMVNYDNIKVVWDGKNARGKKVPDGTYYYLVEIKGVKSYTGWINIRTGGRD